MIQWPTSLQQLVNADSFNLKKGSTTIRSDVDIGPAKVRRRMTKSTDTVTVGFNLTKAEYLIHEEFYDIDLNGGVNAFEFKNPITQVVEVYRYNSEPEYKSIGGVNFVVNMQWERLP